MSELTREQVENKLQWCGIWDISQMRWKAELLAHDAALRAQLEELTERAEKTERILSEAGIPQSIQDVRNAWSALTERDEQIASLTAQLAEKEKDQHYINISYLQQQLAAMTQERDAFISGGVTEELLRKHDGYIKLGNGCSIVRTQHFKDVLHNLAAREQRVRELEGTLENYQTKYHDAMAILSQWGNIDKADAIAQFTEAQATIARLECTCPTERERDQLQAKEIGYQKALTEATATNERASEKIDQLQATVTAQAKEIVRLTACITAQGAQMLAYHDTLKQVLAGGKEGA